MQKLQKGLSTFGALKHISSEGMTVLEGEKLAACRQILLEMLRDVDTLCERNGIPYTLCGGTALGAVRHGGMIWTGFFLCSGRPSASTTGSIPRRRRRGIRSSSSRSGKRAR